MTRKLLKILIFVLVSFSFDTIYSFNYRSKLYSTNSLSPCIHSKFKVQRSNPMNLSYKTYFWNQSSTKKKDISSIKSLISLKFSKYINKKIIEYIKQKIFSKKSKTQVSPLSNIYTSVKNAALNQYKAVHEDKPQIGDTVELPNADITTFYTLTVGSIFFGIWSYYKSLTEENMINKKIFNAIQKADKYKENMYLTSAEECIQQLYYNTTNKLSNQERAYYMKQLQSLDPHGELTKYIKDVTIYKNSTSRPDLSGVLERKTQDTIVSTSYTSLPLEVHYESVIRRLFDELEGILPSRLRCLLATHLQNILDNLRTDEMRRKIEMEHIEDKLFDGEYWIDYCKKAKVG